MRWLSQLPWIRKTSSPCVRKHPRRAAARCRPSCEALEERAVPALLSVLPQAQTLLGANQFHYLTDAVTAAAASPGADVIQVLPGASSGTGGAASGTLTSLGLLPNVIFSNQSFSPGTIVRIGAGANAETHLVTGAATINLLGLGLSVQLTLDSPLMNPSLLKSAPIVNTGHIGVGADVSIQGMGGAAVQVGNLDVLAGATGVTLDNLNIDQLLLKAGSAGTQLLNSLVGTVVQEAGSVGNQLVNNVVDVAALLTGVVGGSSGSEVSNTRFTNGAYLLLNHQDGAEVHHNMFDGTPTAEAGLIIKNSKDVSVHDNNFDMVNKDAILVMNDESETSVRIDGNIIDAGGANSGITVRKTADKVLKVLIEDNNFQGSKIGVNAIGDGTTADTIDAGGGALGSAGRNSFGGITPAGAASGSFALKLSGTNATAEVTAYSNTFAAADPTQVIKDDTHNKAVGGGTNGTGKISVTAAANPTQAATTTTLSSSAPSAFQGQPVTFTATVASTTSGAITGTVTFMDGSTNLGTGSLDSSGKASLITSALGAGTHLITAIYGGSATYDDSTSAVLQQRILSPQFAAVHATIPLGNDGQVQFTDQSNAPNVFYSYSFNDADFNDLEDVAGSWQPTALVPAAYLAAPGTHTIFGRLTTSDGATRDFSTNISVVAYSNWASAGGFTKQVVSAQNAAGNPVLFAIGGDNALWMNSTFVSSGWTSLGGYVKQIAVGQNAAGAPVVFAIGGDNALWVNSSLNSMGWTSAGGYVKEIDVTRNASNNLVAFAIGGDNAAWMNSSLTPAGWSSLGGYVKQIEVTQNAAGSPVVFAIGGDNAAWMNAALTPAGWSSAGGYVKQIAVGRDGAGAISLFGIGGDNALWLNNNFTQAGWSSLGGYVKQISVERNCDGTLSAFAIGGDNAAWIRTQSRLGAAFRDWSSLGGFVKSLATARNADGTLDLFAIGGDNAAWLRKQGV